MAYRIEYGPSVPAKYQHTPAFLRIQTMTAAFLLIFVLLATKFFPAGSAVLRHYLIPSAPTVTQTALCDLLSDLRTGISLNEAFTAFCVQIISHEEILAN